MALTGNTSPVDGLPPDRWRDAAIVLCAALPRLIYLLVTSPSFSGPYWTLSTGLLRDGSLAIDGSKTTEFDPMYPMFIAVSRLIVGDHVPLVRLAQIGIAAIGAVYLCRLTATLTGSQRAGTAAAVLYSFDPVLVRHAVVQTQFALFTTLLIGFANTFVSGPTTRRSGLAGFLLGLAVLTRATAAPLLVFAPAVRMAGRHYRAAATMLMVAAVVVLPLLLRNHRLNESWWPTRGGVNLFIANSSYTSALLPEHDLDILEPQAGALVRSRVPSIDAMDALTGERAANEVLTREALAYITAHPIETLRQKALNVLYFLSPRVVPYRVATADTRIVVGPNGRPIVVHSEPQPLHEVIAWGTFSLLVLAAAVMGLWVRRRRLREDAVLLCVLVNFVAVNAMYVPATRYRAPMEFVLIFYAAVAVAAASAGGARRQALVAEGTEGVGP